MINLASGYTCLENSPKFSKGEVIEHQMYGYRGVIVYFNTTFYLSHIPMKKLREI